MWIDFVLVYFENFRLLAEMNIAADEYILIDSYFTLFFQSDFCQQFRIWTSDWPSGNDSFINIQFKCICVFYIT